MNVLTGMAAALLAVMLLVAVVIDVRTRRIPNALSFGGAAAALLLAALAGNWPGAGAALGGWAVGLAVTLPMYALRVMGAGDVKLLAAVGALLGPLGAVDALLFTFAAGGATSLAALLWRDGIRETARRYWFGLRHWLRGGIWLGRRAPEADGRSLRAPYALAIAAGALLALLLPLFGEGMLLVARY